MANLYVIRVSKDDIIHMIGRVQPWTLAIVSSSVAFHTAGKDAKWISSSGEFYRR